MSDSLPAEAEVLSWFEKLSNWGRWGPDDRLGTLNLITAETRVAAARLVEEGHVVSLAWDVDTAPQRDQTYGPPNRFFVTTGQGLADEHRIDPHGNPDNRMAGALEYLGYVFHGYSVTHLDALSHVFWDRKMYNGVPAEAVSSSHGATAHDVTAVKGGVITRGILVDVPAFRGVDWLEPGDPVTATEVRAVLAAQGSEVHEGDALLLRTGYGKRRSLQGPDDVRALGRAGWHASCAPLFHEWGVSLIGADTAQDVVPSGYDSVVIPVHTLGLVAMGLYMIDNMYLEELSAKCASAGRHTFELMVSTIPFLGATGSPVNPLAVF